MRRLMAVALILAGIVGGAVAQDVKIAGLINTNDVMRWGNEDIKDKDLTSVQGVEIMDINELVLNSMDCIDIVCYLLATTGTGVDYVILSLEKGKEFEIFDAESKVVIKKSSAESLLTDLRGLVEGEPEPVATDSAAVVADSAFAVLQAELPVAVDTTTADTTAASEAQKPLLGVDLAAYLPEFMKKLPAPPREKVNRVRLDHFRGTESFAQNPANLARNYRRFTAWNLLDMEYNFNNSLLTPGWYKEWLTSGGTWSSTQKRDFLNTFQDESIQLRSHLSFPTLFGFRIGPVGVNLSASNWLKFTLPGSLPALPFTDIRLHETLDLSGLEVETVPFVNEVNLAYGRSFQTPIGAIGAGLGVNIMTAAGYIHTVTNELEIRETEDSLFVHASGEGWYTLAGAAGKLTDPNLDNLDPMELIGSQTLGFNLGARADLFPFLHQEIEVLAGLKNIGAKFSWNGVSHEAWTYDLRAEGIVSLSELGDDSTASTAAVENASTEVLSTDGNLEIKVPTVFTLTTIYQPVSQVFLLLNFEKALSGEDVLYVQSAPRLQFQVSYLPIPALELNFRRSSLFQVPIYSFGGGLHFGIWDAGMQVNFHNGFNSDAKGIGFGFTSSWHF